MAPELSTASSVSAGAARPASALLPITVAVVEDEYEVRTLFELAVRSNPRLSLAFSAGTAAEAIAQIGRASCRERVS
jgi:hypothetical protein